MFKIFGCKGHSGWGPEQADLVDGSPVHSGGIGTKWALRSLPIQIILGFYKQKARIALSLCERWTATFFLNTKKEIFTEDSAIFVSFDQLYCSTRIYFVHYILDVAIFIFILDQSIRVFFLHDRIINVYCVLYQALSQCPFYSFLLLIGYCWSFLSGVFLLKQHLTVIPSLGS